MGYTYKNFDMFKEMHDLPVGKYLACGYLGCFVCCMQMFCFGISIDCVVGSVEFKFSILDSSASVD